MIIATAKDSDLEAIYQLIQATIDSCYPPFYPPRAVSFFKHHHSREAIAQRLQNDLVFVAKEGERLVGTGSLVGSEISGLFVLPDLQGSGIGGALMKELERQAVLRNITTVELDVSIPSRVFYEHLGYIAFEERSTDVGEGQRLDHWHAYKKLDYSPSLLREKNSFNLDGKKFTALENSESGEVSAQTLFEYHQDGNLIWVTYSGGEIIYGQLLGKVLSEDKFISRYQHLNKQGTLMTGTCETRVSMDAHDRLQLNETWEWTSGDLSSGTSVLIEMRESL